ncbi:MAG: HK97 family phage prohead protease [Pseudomonadota bacterium]
MPNKRSSPPPNQFSRHVAIHEKDIVDAERSVAVAFSSETDKVRYYGRPQILLHESQAADFEGLRDAGSVLWNHNPDHVVGLPIDVTLDETKRMGRARIKFDQDAATDVIYKKVLGGSVRGVSVGFRVQDWEQLEDGEKWTSPQGRTFTGPMDVATSWKAYEFSLTPIPADASVGVGRTVGPREPEGDGTMATNAEASGLKTEVVIDPRTVAPPVVPPVTPPAAPPAAVPDPGPKGEDMVRAERARVREVREMCSKFEATKSLADSLCESGASVEAARAQILETLGKAWPNLESNHSIESVTGGDERSKWAAAAEDRLALRTSWGRAAIKDEKRIAAASEVGSHRLIDLARESLRRAKVDTRRMSDSEMIQRAITHTVSDFDYILANVANKALVKAYTEAPATWRPFVDVTSHSDFKAHYVTKLSDAGDLIVTKELEPMPETSFSDTGENFALSTYSRRFGISRQAIINDDLSAFDRIPTAMGQAARRVPAKLFYDLLVSASGVGPTMTEDSLALFATTHTSGCNYVAAAGAIAIATLSTARSYIRLQKAMVPATETAPYLNLTASYLLVPTLLEGLALQFVTQVTPAASANVLPGWMAALTVIVEPRLDAATNGGTAWYLVVPTNQISCVQMAFLDGKEEPTMIRVDGTNFLGIEWGVYLDCGVKFIDHRGWYRVRGA